MKWENINHVAAVHFDTQWGRVELSFRNSALISIFLFARRVKYEHRASCCRLTAIDC